MKFTVIAISNLTPRIHSNKPTKVNREDLDVHTDNAKQKIKLQATSKAVSSMCYSLDNISVCAEKVIFNVWAVLCYSCKALSLAVRAVEG